VPNVNERAQTARQALTAVALSAAVWLASAVPLPLAYRVARLAGLGAWLVWPGGRRRSVANMLHVAGGDPVRARRYARASFAFYGTYLVDFLRFGTLSAASVTSAVDFDEWAGLEAQRAGNGIVFVTLHFGNWDLAGAAIAQRMPLTAIADTFDNPAIDRVVVSARRRLGMRIIAAESPGPEVLRALRRNDVLAALADVPQVDGGVRVNFFGAPLDVPDGIARIALRTGAPVIVGGVWRKGPTATRYDASTETVDFAPSGDRDADVRGLTQAMMHALERLVLRAPEQWYIFRALWLADAPSR
jgi:Kdo2-lipid IVA lauroyltransferase/acyltransferase